MRKRLRKKLERQGKLPKQNLPRFPFEASLIRSYQKLQELDESNSLLLEGHIDESGHFQFDPGKWNFERQGRYPQHPVPADTSYHSTNSYIIHVLLELSELERGARI